eukprot:GAHX01001024.1.p1 GENE.GAHX01001024.1~~GAHX01001024.1.p1  ORF type:complete len:1836 (+),score=336.48 GAHX01001024.1:59-5566(+)
MVQNQTIFIRELSDTLHTSKKARQWQDLVQFLEKLKKLFTNYSNSASLYVPDDSQNSEKTQKIAKMLFERLNHCLGEQMPSSVRLTTLQVYDSIFRILDEPVFLENLSVIASSLFSQTYYSIPKIQDQIIDLYYLSFLKFPISLRYTLEGFVASNLFYLQETKNPVYERTIDLFETISEVIKSKEVLFDAVYKAIINCPDTRLGGTNFLNYFLIWPKPEELSDEEYVSYYMNNQPELVTTAILESLKEDNSLFVKRNILDLLLLKIPLEGSFIYESDKMMIVSSLFSLFLENESTVNRRVLEWLFQTEITICSQNVICKGLLLFIERHKGTGKENDIYLILEVLFSKTELHGKDFFQQIIPVILSEDFEAQFKLATKHDISEAYKHDDADLIEPSSELNRNIAICNTDEVFDIIYEYMQNRLKNTESTIYTITEVFYLLDMLSSSFKTKVGEIGKTVKQIIKYLTNIASKSGVDTNTVSLSLKCIKIANKVDMNLSNSQEITPLHGVCSKQFYNKHCDSFKLFIVRYYQHYLLTFAALSENYECVEEFNGLLLDILSDKVMANKLATSKERVKIVFDGIKKGINLTQILTHNNKEDKEFGVLYTKYVSALFERYNVFESSGVLNKNIIAIMDLMISMNEPLFADTLNSVRTKLITEEQHMNKRIDIDYQFVHIIYKLNTFKSNNPRLHKEIYKFSNLFLNRKCNDFSLITFTMAPKFGARPIINSFIYSFIQYIIDFHKLDEDEKLRINNILKSFFYYIRLINKEIESSNILLTQMTGESPDDWLKVMVTNYQVSKYNVSKDSSASTIIKRLSNKIDLTTFNYKTVLEFIFMEILLLIRKHTVELGVINNEEEGLNSLIYKVIKIYKYLFVNLNHPRDHSNEILFNFLEQEILAVLKYSNDKYVYKLLGFFEEIINKQMVILAPLHDPKRKIVMNSDDYENTLNKENSIRYVQLLEHLLKHFGNRQSDRELYKKTYFLILKLIKHKTITNYNQQLYSFIYTLNSLFLSYVNTLSKEEDIYLLTSNYKINSVVILILEIYKNFYSEKNTKKLKTNVEEDSSFLGLFKRKPSSPSLLDLKVIEMIKDTTNEHLEKTVKLSINSILYFVENTMNVINFEDADFNYFKKNLSKKTKKSVLLKRKSQIVEEEDDFSEDTSDEENSISTLEKKEVWEDFLNEKVQVELKYLVGNSNKLLVTNVMSDLLNILATQFENAFIDFLEDYLQNALKEIYIDITELKVDKTKSEFLRTVTNVKLKKLKTVMNLIKMIESENVNKFMIRLFSRIINPNTTILNVLILINIAIAALNIKIEYHTILPHYYAILNFAYSKWEELEYIWYMSSLQNFIYFIKDSKDKFMGFYTTITKIINECTTSEGNRKDSEKKTEICILPFFIKELNYACPFYIVNNERLLSELANSFKPYKELIDTQELFPEYTYDSFFDEYKNKEKERCVSNFELSYCYRYELNPIILQSMQMIITSFNYRFINNNYEKKLEILTKYTISILNSISHTLTSADDQYEKTAVNFISYFMHLRDNTHLIDNVSKLILLEFGEALFFEKSIDVLKSWGPVITKVYCRTPDKLSVFLQQITTNSQQSGIFGNKNLDLEVVVQNINKTAFLILNSDKDMFLNYFQIIFLNVKNNLNSQHLEVKICSLNLLTIFVFKLSKNLSKYIWNNIIQEIDSLLKTAHSEIILLKVLALLEVVSVVCNEQTFNFNWALFPNKQNQIYKFFSNYLNEYNQKECKRDELLDYTFFCPSILSLTERCLDKKMEKIKNEELTNTTYNFVFVGLNPEGFKKNMVPGLIINFLKQTVQLRKGNIKLGEIPKIKSLLLKHLKIFK